MKLLVLGATGGIGIEIVRQALARHHAVTALVRNPDALKHIDGALTVTRGNLLSRDDLARTAAGHDAVLSAFGLRVPIARDDAHLLRDFALALTAAMPRAAVRRGLVVSTAFLFKDAIFPPVYPIGRLFFPSVVADATDMERILDQTDLDLTIVRPPQLTDRPYTGRFRVREGRLPFAGFSIPRADVADFMLQTVESGAFPRAVVAVCS